MMYRFVLAACSISLLIGCAEDPTTPSGDRNLPRTIGVPADAPGHFRLPVGITVDEQGNAYVADRDNHRVQKIAPDGEVLDIWNLGFGVAYVDVAPTGEVVAAAREILASLDAEGTVLWQQSVDGAPKVTVADDGTIATMSIVYQVSPPTYDVRTYDSTGAALATWRIPLARGFAFGPDGFLHVVVGSRDVGYVLRGFTFDGDFAGSHVLETDDHLDVRLETTRSVDIDSEGNVYVAATNELVVFTPAGIPSAPMVIPWNDGQVVSSIAFDETHGDIVAGLQPREVVRGRLENDGIIGRWRLGNRTGSGVFLDPQDLAVSSRGRVAVADGGNRRVALFDRHGDMEASVDAETWIVAFDDERLVLGGYDVTRFDDLLQPSEEWSLVGSGGLHGPEVEEIEVWEDAIVSLVDRCSVERAETGLPMQQLLLCEDRSADRIVTMARSPDGHLVLLQAGMLRTYDAEGALLDESSFDLPNVFDMDFDRRGRLYVATVNDGVREIFEVSRDGAVLRPIEIPELQRLRHFTIGPDDALYALDGWREVVYRVEL